MLEQLKTLVPNNFFEEVNYWAKQGYTIQHIHDNRYDGQGFIHVYCKSKNTIRIFEFGMPQYEFEKTLGPHKPWITKQCISNWQHEILTELFKGEENENR